MKALVFSLLLALPAVCISADKTFPLGKAFSDSFFACYSANDAVGLAKVVAQGNEVETDIATFAAVRRGKCGGVEAVVVYKKLIYEEDRDGQHYAVYEATVRGKQFFVPMKGWRHDSI